MCNISDLVSEMNEWSGMLASRDKASGGASRMELVGELVANTATKIARLSTLNPTDVTALSDAIAAQGLQKEQRQAVTAAIDAVFEKALDDVPEAEGTPKNQVMMDPQNYVTQPFMTKIRGKGSFDEKISTTADFIANKL